MAKDTVSETTVKEAVKTEKPAETAVYYEAVGRRKVATVRVRLYVAGDDGALVNGQQIPKGDMVVNGRPADNYFPGELSKRIYLEPFRTTNTLGRFSVSVRASGGGIPGQLQATILGISRALLKVDLEKFRPILKKRGFLTRDPRAKERRKAGLAHKARAKKQSPKR